MTQSADMARQFMRYALVLAGLALLWEVAPLLFGVPQHILPRLSAVATALEEDQLFIARNGIITIQTVIVSFLVTVAVACPLALAAHAQPRLALVQDPLIVVSQLIPRIALIPLVTIWFGMGSLTTKVVIAVLIAFFPVYDGLRDGLRAANQDLVFQSGLLGKPPRWTLLHIELPQAMPQFFTGLRTAALLVVTGVVVGEFLASGDGLGFQITNAMRKFDSPSAYGYILAITGIGLLLYTAIAALGIAIVAHLRLRK